jgi:phosphoglycerol transferase MdoB-like AlkP superfamily enzyme
MLLTGNYDDPAVVIMYMTSALAPAFAEEFLFRGGFYTNLRPYGRTQAIILSALLFALMHQNIAQLFYTFVGGVAMAVMYELTGSIWCSVIYHMLNNQLAIVNEVLYYGKFGEAVEPLLSWLDIVIFILGILSAVILSVVHHRNHAIKSKLPPDAGQGSISPLYAEQALTTGESVKGMINPGIIVFTSVTAFFMLLSWLSLLIV